jgi:hypothetical protein
MDHDEREEDEQKGGLGRLRGPVGTHDQHRTSQRDPVGAAPVSNESGA